VKRRSLAVFLAQGDSFPGKTKSGVAFAISGAE
jgi:hypothetical protein